MLKEYAYSEKSKKDSGKNVYKGYIENHQIKDNLILQFLAYVARTPADKTPHNTLH